MGRLRIVPHLDRPAGGSRCPADHPVHGVSADARELPADNRPLDETPWVAAAVVDVEPARIDAPDIIRIVVERGGTSVAPLENLLKPRTYMNGNGEQAVIHGGEVRFPLSAFAPGSPVTISAIPQAGAAFVMRLNDEQLRTLK